MSRGKPFRMIGIAIVIIELILILNNIANDISYKTVEATVTKIESHLKTMGRGPTMHVVYTYIEYTVNGMEYTNCSHADYGTEVGGTISVRYKPSNPAVILPKTYHVVDLTNGMGFLLAAMVFGTGEILDHKEKAAGTDLFGIG